MRRDAVDIRGDHVRLDAVGAHLFRGIRMGDWADQVEQLASPVAIAELGKSPNCPQRGVRILPAVLADAGRIAPNIAGIVYCAVERWRKQGDQPILRAHQLLIQRLHGLSGVFGAGCP